MSRKRKNRKVHIPQIKEIRDIKIEVSGQEFKFTCDLWNTKDSVKLTRVFSEVLEMMMS